MEMSFGYKSEQIKPKNYVITFQLQFVIDNRDTLKLQHTYSHANKSWYLIELINDKSCVKEYVTKDHASRQAHQMFQRYLNIHSSTSGKWWWWNKIGENEAIVYQKMIRICKKQFSSKSNL
jgi:hypothetical protein